MKKINLGCGTKYMQGYINTDVTQTVKADVYFDLNKTPYPFRSNFADEIYMDNVLEHLDDIPRVIEEIHRILKPGAVLRIYVPYAKSDGAFNDPTHMHYFTERSMDYFSRDNAYGFYADVSFQIKKAELFNANKTTMSKLRLLIPFKKILKIFFFNIYDGVYFEMRKVRRR